MSVTNDQHPSIASVPKQGRGTKLVKSVPFWFSAVLLCGVLALLRSHRRLAFDLWAAAHQLRSISLLHVFLGLFFIYSGFGLRAARWSVLLRPVKRVPWTALAPTQAIGFTAVALFGRVADLSRPYLTARQLGTPVSTQLAIYSIERTFDLAAAAILFSVTLAFAPRGMPHHEAFTRAGLLALAATAVLGCAALLIRMRGDRISLTLSNLTRRFSQNFAESAATRVLELRQGFGAIVSVPQFLAALAYSLVMWVGIALTYLEAAHAFIAAPLLAHTTFAQIMLLLATSLGASLFQLPIVGWFTQTAVVAGAYHAFFGVPLELASACGALTLALTTLSIIPAGLLATRLQHLTLRQTAAPQAQP